MPTTRLTAIMGSAMPAPAPFFWGALYNAAIYLAIGLLLWPHYEPISITAIKAVVFGVLMEGFTELKQRRQSRVMKETV